MTMKGFIVLIFIVIGVLLFAGVGFDIVHSTKLNLMALGLASVWAGVLVHIFMPGPEIA